MIEKIDKSFLNKLGIKETNSGVCGVSGWLDSPAGAELISSTPINESEIARVKQGSVEDYHNIVEQSQAAFEKWRMVPAPERGEIIRQIGNKLREKKTELGRLVTLEMGKILAEGEGEVQEMIDIADFSVGLSRQLYGKSIQ